MPRLRPAVLARPSVHNVTPRPDAHAREGFLLQRRKDDDRVLSACDDSGEVLLVLAGHVEPGKRLMQVIHEGIHSSSLIPRWR
jgi:hypothetical protein